MTDFVHLRNEQGGWRQAGLLPCVLAGVLRPHGGRECWAGWQQGRLQGLQSRKWGTAAGSAARWRTLRTILGRLHCECCCSLSLYDYFQDVNVWFVFLRCRQPLPAEWPAGSSPWTLGVMVGFTGEVLLHLALHLQPFYFKWPSIRSVWRWHPGLPDRWFLNPNYVKVMPVME